MKVAVVGCGYWGVNILRTLKKMGGVCVKAVCDPNHDALNGAASLCGGDVKTYTEFEMVLQESIDAMIIASPPKFHVDQAIAALQNSIPVLLEKPPVLNIRDLDRLLDAARWKTLVCDYVFLFNPLFRFARGFVKQVGVEPLYVQLDWLNRGIVRTDVSAWWSAGPHAVSLLAWFFDDVKPRAFFETNGAPGAQSPHAVAHFDVNGALATVDVSWTYPIKTRQMKIAGADHTVIIDDVTRRVWVIDRFDKISAPDIPYKPMPLEESLLDFFHCVKTGDESPAGPEMIEKVTRLMVEGR